MKRFAAIALLLLAGCEIKDRDGHTLIEQKPPRVNVKVNPTIVIQRPKIRRCRCCEGSRCICGTNCTCQCRQSRAEAPPKGTIYSAEHPAMNLPVRARQRNWGTGSCVLASTCSLLRWQGRDDLANEIRRRFSGGQTAQSLHAKLDGLGLQYASTLNGSVEFLEWSIRTRRGAGITFFPGHFVCLVDMTDTTVELMDNNHVSRRITLNRQEFMRRFRNYGGWATVVLAGAPAAPLPN